VNTVWVVVTYETISGVLVDRTLGIYADYERAAHDVIRAVDGCADAYREYNKSEVKIDCYTTNGLSRFSVLERKDADQEFFVQDVYEIVRHEIIG
jgi:hypothetical protein